MQITAPLLKQYGQIPKLSSAIIDTEISYYCAFNFPAILLTVEGKRWPELSDTYKILCKDSKFNVRRTLSYSLHEIARIFKPLVEHENWAYEVVKNQLIPAFDIFFHDIEDVKLGVVEHFGDFLEALPELDFRKPFVTFFWELQAETDAHWRYRKLLGQQLHIFYKLYPIAIVSDALLRLTLTLLRDRIAAVRQVAALAIGALYFRLSNPEFPEFISLSRQMSLAAVDMEGINELNQELLKLATARGYAERQLFIRICFNAFCNDFHYSIVSNFLLQPFLSLVNDPVSNVRIVLARTVSECFLSNKDFAKNPLVLAAMDILRQDVDPEVAFFFSQDAVAKLDTERVDDSPPEKHAIASIMIETKLHHHADSILHESEHLDIEPKMIEQENATELLRVRSPSTELVQALCAPNDLKVVQPELLVLQSRNGEIEEIVVDAPKRTESPPALVENEVRFKELEAALNQI